MEFKKGHKEEIDEIPDERLRPGKPEETREKTTQGENLKDSDENDFPNSSEESREIELKAISPELPKQEPNEQKAIIEMQALPMQPQMMIPMQQPQIQHPQMQQFQMHQPKMQQFQMQQAEMQELEKQQPPMGHQMMIPMQQEQMQRQMMMQKPEQMQEMRMGVTPNQMQGYPYIVQPYPNTFYDELYILRPHDHFLNSHRLPPPQKQSIPKYHIQIPLSSFPMGDRWAFNLSLSALIIILLIAGGFAIPYAIDFALVLYVIYWIDCCCAKTPKLFRNAESDSQTLQKIEALKRLGPTTSWDIECYKENMKKSTKISCGWNSGKKTAIRRPNTHHAHEDMEHRNWTDNSPVLTCMDKVKISRIRFRVLLAFVDPNLEIEYTNKRDIFVSENNREKDYNFTETHTIKGFEPFILSYHGSRLDFLRATRNKYYLRCFFFLGWYMRYYIVRYSDQIDYDFIKVIHSS
jgi:hypothetical protein